MNNVWIIGIVVLLVSGCATSKPIYEDITSRSNEPKQIVGSGDNGRVLHKDYFFQNAQPGDWQMTLSGKPLSEPLYITQSDIDYSLKILESLNKELLSESPGSVRSMLDDLFDDGLVLPGKPTEPDEVNYTLIQGKVIEYINDIRGGRQIILIITGSENRALFDGLYKSPPYLKAVVDVPPGQVAYTLIKKVNSAENKIFCLTEDIQSTKKWLEKVKDIKDYRAPPKPPKPVKPVTKYTPQYAGADSTIGFYVGNISDFDFANKYGFTFGLEDQVPYSFAIIGALSLDYLTNNTELDSDSALILGFTLGCQFFSNFVVYAGGGIGAQFPMNDGWFTWKVNGGLRVQVNRFFTKFDVSYYPIIGPALGVGLGVFF